MQGRKNGKEKLGKVKGMKRERLLQLASADTVVTRTDKSLSSTNELANILILQHIKMYKNIMKSVVLSRIGYQTTFMPVISLGIGVHQCDYFYGNIYIQPSSPSKQVHQSLL